ncbi:hypothetical protein M7I_4445 [Glarea lozoyensis 74030]|uniref:Uncharacterized protein n=1 Tax=Glarea lozoyensis (strain ATCC 74030 / MF5533) TaxID=1104152 RepID=H0EP74_GLAL7|nr:hypothetical protein M7I_4445 [Glarea lozoyensis 74030]
MKPFGQQNFMASPECSPRRNVQVCIWVFVVVFYPFNIRVKTFKSDQDIFSMLFDANKLSE